MAGTSIFNLVLFNAQFPELSDENKYPVVVTEAMFDVACLYIDPKDFCGRMLTGKSLDYAINLMTAHLLMLQKQRLEEDNPGDAQGGFINSAKIGDVEVTKETIPTRDRWQWWLGQTPYGQALLALLSVVSVGGTSVGGLEEREGFRKIGGVFW